MKQLNVLSTILTLGWVMFVITGCSSTAPSSSIVSSTESHFNQTVEPNEVREYAPLNYEQAKESLEKLKVAHEKGAKDKELGHLAYLSRKHSDQAYQQAQLKMAEEKIKNIEIERKKLLSNFANSREMDALSFKNQQTQGELDRIKAQNEEMSKILTELKAKETERGLVLTFDSILFELNKATLKSGSERSISKLAKFLKNYPDRELLVEGFTDSTGDPNYNDQLSQNRAEAIKSTLVTMGIEPGRIITRGYGENYPVATNETRAGRQLNRRVEVVVANQGETVSERR